MSWRLWVRQAIGAFERERAPGMGYCYRCGRPWHKVEGHTTSYRPGSGMFPLCKPCWSELETPMARLPFYRQLWELWERLEEDLAKQAIAYRERAEMYADMVKNHKRVTWEEIEAAVMTEMG